MNRSESELKLNYSMTIIRMINGLTAPFQKGLYAMSIASICEKIGLPPDMVEYRHQSSHNKLPSLAELRKCAQDALEWLKINYWGCQLNHFEQKINFIRDKLKEIKVVQKSIYFDKYKTNPPKNKFALMKKTKKHVNTIVETLTSAEINSLLVPLIVDEFLVPKNKKIIRCKYKELPRQLKRLWMSSIKQFSASWENFLPTLLVFIVDRLFKVCSEIEHTNSKLESQIKELTFKASILKCWYFHLLDTLIINKNDQSSQTIKKKDESHDKESDEIEENYVSIPAKEIFYLCFKSMSKTSVKIIKKTILAMKSRDERDAMIPKLKELFHYKSRAMSLLNEEQILLNTGEMKYENHDKKRSYDEITQENELDFEQFEELIKLSMLKQKNTGWELCEDELPPGIGLKIDGTAPNHLDLPEELDTFNHGKFYFTKEDCELYNYQYTIKS